MTRRLGGFRRRGFPALASLSLVSALACGGAITGCGGDDNGGGGGNTIEDGGGDASETGTPAKDAGADAKSTADAGLDSGTTTVVDSGTTTVVDSGTTTVVDSGTTTVVDSGTEETPDTGVDSGEQTGTTDSGVHDSGVVDSSTGVGPIDSGTITDSGHGGSTVDANDAAAGPTASFSTSAFPLGPGNCGGAAVSAAYTITNTGGSTLNISNAAVTGSVFGVTPTILAIAPGQSGHLTVSATVPQNSTAATALTTNLTFTTNDTAHPSGSVTASVIPTGVTLAWASGSLTAAAFGLQPEGSTPTQSLTLTNTGNASVTVGFGAVTAPFTLTPTTSGVLAQGASVGLTAGFDPTDIQQHSTTSTFSLPNGTAVCGTSIGSLALSGTGGSGSVTGWPTTPFDFGATACGTAPNSTSFTLNNSGTEPVQITSVTSSGTTTFTTDATTASIVPPGGSLVVNISAPAIPAAPSDINAIFSGSISFTTNAFDDTTAHVVNLTEEPLGAILAFDTLGNNNFGNFGGELVPSSTPVGFNVVNTGNAPATVTLGISGDPNNAFAVSTPSFSVSNGTPESENAIFAPPSFGTFGGTINLTTGSTLCAPLPAGLSLSGSGNAGTIAVSTQSIPFATPCGSTATAQTFTVTNSGNEPISWSASLAAGGGSKYTISVSDTNGGVTTTPFTVGNTSLGAGDFDTITVQPNPMPQTPLNTSPSAFSDTITLTSNVPGDNPHTVTLSETPLGDIIQWTATTFAFGNQPVGTDSNAQTFTITNAANAGSPSANIAIQKGGDDPDDFSLSASSGTLAAGATSPSISVAFDAPDTANPYDATITLATDDNLCALLPLPVNATGTAVVAGPEYSVASLGFGNVNCGTAAGAQTFTVSNTGGNQFTIQTLTLSNGTTSGPYFTVTSNPSLPAIVPPNTSNAVTITVTPNAIPATVPSVPDTGTYSDALLITTNADIDSPNTSIPLSMGAKGVIIANSLVSTTWNFGQVPFGSTGDYNIPIDNTGNAAAFATLTTTQTTDYGLPSGLIPPGNGLFTATFTPPNQAGTFPDTGTLTIAPAEGQVFCQPLPASWGPPVAVTLSGTETNNSVTSVSPTSLPFPAANCGGLAPQGEPVTIFNSANAPVNFTAQLLNGTFYTLSTTGGAVPAGGNIGVVVTPQLNLAQNAGADTGSAPYSDTLMIQITGGAATTYFVPITMTVNGVVLSLVPQGGSGQVLGYDFTCNVESPFTVQASTGSGGTGATIQNNGNVAGTVSVVASGFGGEFFAFAGNGNINSGAESTFQFEANLPPGPGVCEPGIPIPGTATFNATNMCAAPLTISIATSDTFP
jgi:hypothetical protein